MDCFLLCNLYLLTTWEDSVCGHAQCQEQKNPECKPRCQVL